MQILNILFADHMLAFVVDVNVRHCACIKKLWFSMLSGSRVKFAAFVFSVPASDDTR